MNSTLTLDEEQYTTSSLKGAQELKYALPNISLGLLQDSASIDRMVRLFGQSFNLTVPEVDYAFSLGISCKLPSAAKPSVSILGFQFNPIVRVDPPIGKRYPMKVVGRSVASFKGTSLRSIGEDTECTG